ncbi:MAG: hypothetical protein KA369_05895 [Spirochaetes bacterium]|nr:hypothetical protein [Spirochaetota bacterium]
MALSNKCPNCGEKGLSVGLIKCKKCGSVFCTKCNAAKVLGSKCPKCGGEGELIKR